MIASFLSAAEGCKLDFDSFELLLQTEAFGLKPDNTGAQLLQLSRDAG
jgi:hypothetical protein